MSERKTEINSIRPSKRVYDALRTRQYDEKMRGNALSYADILDEWVEVVEQKTEQGQKIPAPTVISGLNSRGDRVEYQHPHQPWIDKLVTILDSWDEKLHNSIKSNLDSFVLLARVPRDIIEGLNNPERTEKEQHPARGGGGSSTPGHHPQDDRLVRRKKKAAS